MKKFVVAATMLSVMGLVLTMGAWAQPASPGPGTTREPTVTTPREPAPPTATLPSTMNEVYASKLIGTNVKNAQGENLGKIDELVIDPKDARIKAAVIAVGGVLGIGAKTVAVPWNKVTMGSGPDRDVVVVAMEKEELEQAPNWQKANNR